MSQRGGGSEQQDASELREDYFVILLEDNQHNMESLSAAMTSLFTLENYVAYFHGFCWEIEFLNRDPVSQFVERIICILPSESAEMSDDFSAM